MTNYTDTLAAIDRLNALDDDDAALLRIMLCSIDHTDTTLLDNPMHELPDDYDTTRDPADTLFDLELLLTACRTPYHSYARDALSTLLLAHSLCPMHCCDYAICFDDETPECATIRAYFPSHDT